MSSPSTVRFGLPVLLAVVILAAFTHPSEGAVRKEMCSPDVCVPNEMCDLPIIGGFCPMNSDMCCSILKSEYRKLCRHHGGECMDRCAPMLQRASTDCPAETTCCVLV